MTGKGPKALLALALTAGAFTLVAAGGESGGPGAPESAQAAKDGKKKGKKKKKPPKNTTRGDNREVVFVGNNWEGTADVLVFNPGTESAKAKCQAKVKPKAKKKCKRNAKKRAAKRRRAGKKSVPAEPPSLKRVARLNIIPDENERLTEIISNPVDLIYFLAIQQLIGEGNNQYVDDMYSTKDGRSLIVSRPSFKDVISLNIATGKIQWRFEVDGQRSDHMAISPDGKTVAVSASTGNVVHILDVATGREILKFPSGDSPHENTYSADGKRIYHASIGLVYTPADTPLTDSTKGKRYFQINDVATGQLLRRIDMGQKLAEAGYPNMSSAVRPMAIDRAERYAYLQVSFFHGYVKYDLATDKVVQVVDLPVSPEAQQIPRELYLLDSAHHGIALDKTDSKLCVAGTMSDYAAIVPVNDPSKRTIINEGTKPYWSTTSRDGRHCFVSWSGTDEISIISYATQKEIFDIKVGDHPQRIRSGELDPAILKSLGG